MKIRAIHEIIYFDGERKSIAPGTVVDLDSTIVDAIPASAYEKVTKAAAVVAPIEPQAEGEPAADTDEAPQKFNASDLKKLNKAKLTEIAAPMGIEVGELTNAELVAAILKAQDGSSDSDDLV